MYKRLVFEKSITRDWPLYIVEMLHNGFTKEFQQQLGWGYSEVLFDCHAEYLDIYRAPVEHVEGMRRFILNKLEESPNFIEQCSENLLRRFEYFMLILKEIDRLQLRELSNEALSGIIKKFIQSHRELEPTFVIHFWFPIQMETHPDREKWADAIGLSAQTRAKTEAVGPEGDRVARMLAQEVSQRMFGTPSYFRFIGLDETDDFLLHKKAPPSEEEMKRRQQGFVFGAQGIKFIGLSTYAEQEGYTIMKKIEKTISRDLPLTNIFAWHQGYTYGLEEWLGWGYSDSFFYMRDGFADIMRPPEEHLVIFKEKVVEKLENDPAWFNLMNKEYDQWIEDIKAFYERVADLSSLNHVELADIYEEYVQHIRKITGPFITMIWLPQWFEKDLSLWNHYKQEIELAIESRKKTEQIYPIGDVFINNLLAKVNETLGIDEALLDFISYQELLSYLHQGKQLNLEELKKRQRGLLFCKQGIILVAPGTIKDVFTDLGYDYDDTDYIKLKEIKGNAAFRGVVRGRVQLIMNKGKISTMEEGNILVTSMTTPEFLPAMHKAAAFITDEGGITCHAAIVAREMKKPCIIGTKIATKTFRDGEIVEVGANVGVVRRING